MNYETIYETAAEECYNYPDGSITYRGYTDANALSQWAYDEHGVNAADNQAAHDALCDVWQRLSNRVQFMSNWQDKQQ